MSLSKIDTIDPNHISKANADLKSLMVKLKTGQVSINDLNQEILKELKRLLK